jgi:4-amino-4-deoxy-L-arabinose transferase-like glycosyltransferase
MKLRPISQWTLYRLRFVIAYGLLTVLTVGLLFVFADRIPPGIGPSEQQSVVASNNVSFTQLPQNIVDIPYHALQKLSVEWLGLSPLGVRLPSLIFGLVTALFVVLLLRRWFKPNVAVTASVVVLTSAWFLSLARLGAPLIMVPFWTSILLLTATYVSQQTKAWKWWRAAFVMSAALSLYTPAMIYLFLAVTLAGLTQPHLRYLLRENNKPSFFIGGFFFVVLLAPLGWGIYQAWWQVWDLLAVPSNLPDVLQFGNNLWQAASNFVNPYNVSVGEVITPVIGIASAALLTIGVARMLRDFHSVRTHVLLIWAAILVPVIGLNPRLTAVLFVPTMLAIAIGINQIIRYWYRLFPLNPYARFFGLLPLGVLLFSIVQFNYQRYIYGMLYSPQATSIFNNDPFIAQAYINDVQPNQHVTVVVNDSLVPLYNTLGAHRKGVTIANSKYLPSDLAGVWIIANDTINDIPDKTRGTFTKLLVSDTAQNARRFWVYQR